MPKHSHNNPRMGLEDNYRKVNELVLCTALLVEETEGQTEQEQ